MITKEDIFSQAIPGAFGTTFLTKLIASTMETPFKLEYTEPDQVYKINDPNASEPEPEYDYFEVEVEKIPTTQVYIKVPKGLDINKLPYKEKNQLLKDAVEETIARYDWVDSDDYDWYSSRPVSEDEAEQFDIYEYNTNNVA